jgi:phage-related protein
MAWVVETFGKVVDDELQQFDFGMRVRLARLQEAIEANGPEALKMPHARRLPHGLWELRVSGQNRIGRAIYLTFVGKKVVILRAFIKKSQKTPPREIEIAWERAKRLMV